MCIHDCMSVYVCVCVCGGGTIDVAHGFHVVENNLLIEILHLEYLTCFAFSPVSHPIIMLSCKQKSRDRIVWCGSLFML